MTEEDVHAYFHRPLGGGVLVVGNALLIKWHFLLLDLQVSLAPCVGHEETTQTRAVIQREDIRGAKIKVRRFESCLRGSRE